MDGSSPLPPLTMPTSLQWALSSQFCDLCPSPFPVTSPILAGSPSLLMNLPSNTRKNLGSLAQGSTEYGI